MDTTNPRSLISRCKSFFGYLPGQTLTEFGTEMRALSDLDKIELIEAFRDAGMPTLNPARSSGSPFPPALSASKAVTVEQQGIR